MPSLASISLVLFSVYLIASAKLDERTRESLFSVSVGLVSLLLGLHFLVLASGVRNFDSLNEFTKAAVYRMDQGGIPSLLLISLLGPLLAAPAAGRQSHRMENLALVTLVLYGVTVALIYSNAGTLKCPESGCLALDEKLPVNSPRIILVLVYDAVADPMLFAAFFFSCLPAVHAGEHVGLLRAGRVADSVKNKYT